MAPLLTMIIPVYNSEKYLAEAVNSILKQPCKDLEIIIVDDGSKDSSGAIADQFTAEHENIRVFHIPNSGVSVARNTGIDNARGTYIGFLDADDVLCRDAYDESTCEMLATQTYDIVGFSSLKGTDDLKCGQMHRANAGFYQKGSVEYRRNIQTGFCSFLYKCVLFSDTVCFPAGLGYCEDNGFLFAMSRKANNLFITDKCWYIYRMNFSSAMHTRNNADYFLDIIDVWEWCGKNSTNEKDRSDCEGNIFSYMVEFIRFSCQYGVPADEIRNKVESCIPFQNAMKHYGKFWMHKESAHFYHEFMQDPRKLWLKYRCIGIGQLAAKKFIRTKPGRVVNNILRYRLPLEAYLVE